MIMYSLDEKIAHVAAWRSSGLTAREYATQYGIKFGSFRNWPLQIKKAQAIKSDHVIIPVKVVVDEKPVTHPITSTATQPLTTHSPSVNESTAKMTSSVGKSVTATASLFPNERPHSFSTGVGMTTQALPTTDRVGLNKPTQRTTLSSYGDAPSHQLTANHNDLSVLLPSGLVVKCQLFQLPDVIAMMEVRYDA